MTDFGAEFATALKAACESSASNVAVSWEKAFGGAFHWQVANPGPFPGTLPAELSGPGLAISLRLENDQSAILFVPESCGWLPGWYAAPDEAQANLLRVLALELGTSVLPRRAGQVDFVPSRVQAFETLLHRGKLAENASILPLTITRDDQPAAACLIWPLLEPAAALSMPPDTDESPTNSTGHPDSNVPTASPSPPPAAMALDSSTAPQSPTQRLLKYKSLEDGLTQLPNYTRSLLKVRVPVVVTLAEIKQPVAKIIEICPGMIIQFNKSCDDMLTLEVGSCKVALGEAVKVGDKFGLRVTGIALPHERFETVRGRTIQRN